MALVARACVALSAARRSCRSTGSISASSWPALTGSPTSTITRSTRPAAVGPISQARRASTVPVPNRLGDSEASATLTTVTRVADSGPERTAMKTMAASRASTAAAMESWREVGRLSFMVSCGWLRR